MEKLDIIEGYSLNHLVFMEILEWLLKTLGTKEEMDYR